MLWKERIERFIPRFKQRLDNLNEATNLHEPPEKFYTLLTVLQPGYLRGRLMVETAGGIELMGGLAREIRERDETNTAYVQELPGEWHHYQIDLRWDLRLSALDYAFSDHESKRVSIRGGYQGWGANGGVEVYYYLPRPGDPNQTDPVNADTELCQLADQLPKPLSEYTLEDRVRFAMSRTSHRIDFVYGMELARMDERARVLLEGKP